MNYFFSVMMLNSASHYAREVIIQEDNKITY